MNWEAIAAIGQMLGSVAVFVTLGYLGAQVRHARLEVQRGFIQARNESARGLLMARAVDEQLNSILVRADTASGKQPTPFVAGLMQHGNLTAEEAHRADLYNRAWWNLRGHTILHVDELPENLRMDFDGMMRRAYGGVRAERLWYQEWKLSLDPVAVRYVDNLLAQPG